MCRTASLTLGWLVLALGVAAPARAGKALPANGPAAEARADALAAGVDDGPPAARPAAGAPAQEADAPHGGQPNILEPQLPLAFWTLIVFLVLMAVLWRFAWGPLAKALHDREHHLQHNMEEAERARTEAAALLAEHRKQMDQANQQIQALLDEARRDAQASAEEIRKAAQAEAEATRNRAVHDISTARDQALTDIWSKTADLAVGIAGKVLQRELSPEDHRRLIDQATSELPTTPRTNGQGARHA